MTEYVRGFKLSVEAGKVRSGPWTPDDSEQAMFPPYTFNQLLFGRRSLAELRYVYPDCMANENIVAVLEVLFPRRPSRVLPMA